MAAQLLRLGATVIFACRSRERAERAIGRCLRRSGAPPSAALFLPLDLSDSTSVRRFAERIASECTLDVLVCNAGGMFSERSLSGSGWEAHMAANAIGHHLLTLLLLPMLRASPMGRVVNVSHAALRHPRLSRRRRLRPSPPTATATPAPSDCPAPAFKRSHIGVPHIGDGE